MLRRQTAGSHAMTSLYSQTSQTAPAKSDPRFIGDLMGSYLLESRTKSLATVRIFACRARSISPDTAVVDAPVIGKPGESLTVTFDTLGILRGHVQRPLGSGFVIAFNLSPDQRNGLASRIAWLKQRSLHQVQDRREYKRVLPRAPRAMLTLGDGQQVACMIIDMSASGVAISADASPPVGEVVAIGEVAGRVARLLPHGFAVQFDTVQPLQQLEKLLTPKPDDQG
ncbi:MAG: PilZ domain-containing protein [Hyphomicrobiales bacterium]|nr:MAG: PilZ domain-containing protein [Hyphomicrobiales bacterium]